MALAAWQGRIDFASLAGAGWTLGNSTSTPSMAEAIQYAQDGTICAQKNSVDSMEATATYSPDCDTFDLLSVPNLGALVTLPSEGMALTGLPADLIVTQLVLTTGLGVEASLAVTLKPYKPCGTSVPPPDKYFFIPRSGTHSVQDLKTYLMAGVTNAAGSAITQAVYTLGYRDEVEHQTETGSVSKGGRGAFVQGAFTVGACADLTTALKPVKGSTTWDIDEAGTFNGALREFVSYTFNGRLAAAKIA